MAKQAEEGSDELALTLRVNLVRVPRAGLEGWIVCNLVVYLQDLDRPPVLELTSPKRAGQRIVFLSEQVSEMRTGSS